jgi:peroxiredoxin
MTKRYASAAQAAVSVLALAAGLAFAQQAEIKPVSVGQPIPEFSLPDVRGGTFAMSSLRGKNVMLIFLRGYAAPDAWCTICHYQYAEILMRELKDEVRKKYGMEVVFVLPYGADVVRKWLDIVPAQLEKIKTWKYPADPAALDETGKKRLERMRMIFPLDILPKDIQDAAGKTPEPFPVLVDAERTVSKGLGLFMTDWGGSKVDQDVPTVYLIDKTGTVRFKYFSQSTVDRPGYDELFRQLEMIEKIK